MTPSLFRVVVAAAAASVIPVAMVALSPSGQGVGDQRAGDGRLIVTIVSSRADMITGGDALVRATGAGAAQGQLTWELNGQRISLINALPARESMVGSHAGQLGVVGLITGIPLGKSTLNVKTAESSETLNLVNYPITGPVFSGPHQKPFVCQTESWKLGPPLDENCSAPTRVEWQYKSTIPVEERGQSAFKPFDPAGPRPADIATTTVNGHSVPYIVRVETGTINRAVYQIAYLRDPASQPAPGFLPPLNWNGRLVYTFGGSCMAGYIQGASSGGVLNDLHLSRGYAVASSSLNVFGNNCNGVISAETLMMVKERFIETVGLPKHTIGWGGSGGAMAQYTIAQNYPGLLDGIIPSATFPDAVTYFIESEDCRLVLRP